MEKKINGNRNDVKNLQQKIEDYFSFDLLFSHLIRNINHHCIKVRIQQSCSKP